MIRTRRRALNSRGAAHGTLDARVLRRVGTSLSDRYRVLRLIGVGGMAAVYEGVHRNGHAVAIKVLNQRLSGDPEVERLFRREAHLANKVQHPGVVPVIDDDVTDDGCVFLVMPLLHGETVRARAERQSNRLHVAEVVVLASGLLEVLAASHQKKIVHRDVKPENLFVTAGGELRVLDFGIGRFFEANEGPTATRSGRAIGTPAFMAPEQALGRGREIDGRTDLWAVGATMFTLISGRFVHDAESVAELAAYAATRVAPRLSSVAPDVHPDLQAVVDKALAFDRAERWSDATAMLEALRSACEAAFGMSVEALPKLAPPPVTHTEPVVDLSKPDALGDVSTLAPAPKPSSRRLANLFPVGPTRTLSVAPSRARRIAVMAAAGALSLFALAGVRSLLKHARLDASALDAGPDVRVEGTPVPTPARVAVVGAPRVANGTLDDADGARVMERVASALEVDGPRALHPSDAQRGGIGEKIAAARANADAASSAPLGVTGIDYAVLGSAHGDDARIEITIAVVDMKTGAQVASIAGHAARAQLDPLMDRLDDAVRQIFSLAPLDADARGIVGRVLPEDPDAAREYVRALDLVAQGELRSARAKLVAIGEGKAKDHARTQLLIAEIAHQVGAEAEAKTYAERARALVSERAERERLPVEARAELASGNAEAALAKLNALGATHRTVEDTIRLAEAASEATQDQDGLAALEELAAFGDVFASDAYLMQLKAAIAWTHDDVESALTLATGAAALAGERLSVRAQAKKLEANALYLSRGDSQEAFAASQEAMRLLLALDDRRDVGSLYLARGDAKYNAMDFDGAGTQYRAGMALDGVAGSPLEPKFLWRLTAVEWKLRRFGNAEKMFSSLSSKSGVDDVSRAYAYLYAAAGAREQGHLVDAEERLREVERLFNARDPSDEVLALVERSALARAQGAASTARSLAEKALDRAAASAKEYQADAESAVGWAYLAERRPESARPMFERALAEAQRINSRIDADEACRGLARCSPEAFRAFSACSPH